MLHDFQCHHRTVSRVLAGTTCPSSNLGKYLITSPDLLNDELVIVTRKYITQHHTTVNINYFKLHLARDILCRRDLLVFRM